MPAATCRSCRCRRTSRRRAARLRFRPQAAVKDVELDLRRRHRPGPVRLLHRLRLLGVPWGTVAADQGRGHVPGRLAAALAARAHLGLIEASCGSTVQAAAAAVVSERGRGAAQRSRLTALTERCLLADLARAAGGARRAAGTRGAGHRRHAADGRDPALVPRPGTATCAAPTRPGSAGWPIEMIPGCAGPAAAFASLDEAADARCGTGSTGARGHVRCSPTREPGPLAGALAHRSLAAQRCRR